MTILLINNRPPYGGIWKYSTSLYAALRQKLGNNVEWLQWDGRLIEDFYRRFGSNILLESVEEVVRMASHLKFLYTLPKGYDLYHITNSAMALACRWRKPTVVTVHDMIPFVEPRGWSDRLLRMSMENTVKADEIICVSEYTKKEMLRFLDVDKERIHVIPNCVDVSSFKPSDKSESRRRTGLPEKSTIILHVGNEEPRKDIPTLLKAFSLFRAEHRDAILVRVGEQFPETEKRIRDLGLSSSVKYFRSVKNIPDFYASADMLVLPSKYEGFGIPAIEAMASGCPVIVAESSSIPEVVGDCALLFKPDDLEALKSLMLDVVGGGSKIRKNIVGGISRAKMFSPEHVAEKTISVYCKILGDAI